MNGGAERHRTRKRRHSGSGRMGAKKDCELALVPDDRMGRLIAADPRLIRLGKQIREHQDILRAGCSRESWRIYLEIEALTNEQLLLMIDKLWIRARMPNRRSRAPGLGPRTPPV